MSTDFYTATDADLEALGWPRWDADSGLRLCPLAQFASVPDGIAMWSISGEVKVKGRDYIDDDTRGGVLAFGIIPGRTRTEKTAEEVARSEAIRRADFGAKVAAMCAEHGLLDLGSGRMLHGQEAADAILDMHPSGKDA